MLKDPARRTRPPVVAFYAPVADPAILERVAFYRLDVQALEASGARVTVCTRLQDIPLDADLYFVWWWTRALPVVLLARIRRRPVAITGAFNWFEGAGDSAYHRRPQWQRLAIRVSARLATLNLFIAQVELDAVAAGLGLRNARYFPCAVDDADEGQVSGAPAKGLTAVGLPELEGKKLVLNFAFSEVGNLERKCVYELIEAFEMLDGSLHLVLCGTSGSGEAALAERVRSSPKSDQISWLGSVSEDVKSALFAAAFIYASPSRFEGFGLAIAEAAVLGLPVVTSPVGSVPEVLGDAAVYCDGTDVVALSNALRRLERDDALRERLSIAGPEAVARFSFGAKVLRMQGVLAEAGLQRSNEVTEDG